MPSQMLSQASSTSEDFGMTIHFFRTVNQARNTEVVAATPAFRSKVNFSKTEPEKAEHSVTRCGFVQSAPPWVMYLTVRYQIKFVCHLASSQRPDKVKVIKSVIESLQLLRQVKDVEIIHGELVNSWMDSFCGLARGSHRKHRKYKANYHCEEATCQLGNQ